MRAAIYLRVSTERQDEVNQEPECRALCAARGWDAVIVRERESGAKDREGWDQVMELARRGQVRAVVIWSLDRVGRRMFETIRDVRELDRLGASVVSVRESWLDTSGPTRGLLLAIFAWVAEHERERLRERVRAGMQRSAARGVKFGRPQVVTDAAVRRAAELRADGQSWAAVTVLLQSEGFGTFNRGSIQRAVTRRSP